MIPVPSNVLRTLQQGDNFLITSHVRPDGDSIGSMAALGHILQKLGKNFCLYNESGLPERYAWLNMPAGLQTDFPGNSWDWIIVLDSGNITRPGDHIVELSQDTPIINIDHHPGNPEFGRVNWVDPGASSVGEMVAGLALELGVGLNGSLGQGIYLAMVSDTGFFSFGNTTPGVLELSARLIREGLDPAEINPKITNQWSIPRIYLQGRALQQAEFLDQGRIALTSVSREMFQQTGAGPEDCEGLVNMLLKVHGVRVAAALREDEPGHIKLSLRSADTDDVQRIAEDLGGGGHKNAAGGLIKASLEQAREMVLQACRRYME